MIQHRMFPAQSPARFNIVLVHGMQEHQKRYSAFASFLAHGGGNVITFDLRGHGNDKSASTRGDFGPEGSRAIFGDIEMLFGTFANALPNILFGHSMGSTIALRYAQTHCGIDKLILSGMPVIPAWQLSLAYRLAQFEYCLKGERASVFDENFVEYNRYFAPCKTSCDWLSRDPDNVRRYIADPLCGYPISARYYREMFDFMRYCFRTVELKQLASNLSMLLLWGAEDPCTGFGRGTRQLLKRCADLGLTACSIEYPGLRHEILQEANRIEVYRDALQYCLHDTAGVRTAA